MPPTSAPASDSGAPINLESHYSDPIWKTPAMRQFVRFKKAHPECLLLFRMGDFYELFGDDAVTAHKALGITLTERTKGMPMAGVPHHALENYLRKLVDHGYRVAICDQVQDPRDAKGVVDRAVTRILTPGTLVDETLLDDNAANHLAAIAVAGDRALIAAAELSTGVFELHEVPANRLLDELVRIAPAEIVYADFDCDPPAWLIELQQAELAPLSPRASWTFQPDTARQLLEEFHGVATLEAFGLAEESEATGVAGGLLHYLQETQCPAGDTKRASLAHLQPPRIASDSDHLVIDATSLRSLEVVRTMRSGGTQGTLLSILQRGKTPMGRRLLRDWLCWPLRDKTAIEARQRAIGAFIADDDFAERLRLILAGIQDIARIGARTSMGRATPRDVVALGKSLARLVELVDEMDARPAFAATHEQLSELGLELAEIEERIVETCVEAAPSHLRAGGLFKDGVDAELDEMRLLQRDANQWLAEYQAQIIEETAITSLKVGFNKVFGYYIELSNTNSDKAPDHFTRKQTLKNAERYVTPELKEFEEKVTSAESRSHQRERELFEDLCARITQHATAIASFAVSVAEIDCLLGLADIAAKRSWCCPTLEESPGIEISGGRHPVLEELLREEFVPNDCELGCPKAPATLALITGPNMAGKSTFIRQVALISLLAHTGSWVPAESARLGMLDRIQTRIGASDELHTGHSTFMVEMTETANILHNATKHSLVILDEIGRGTSTLDGLALAWAIAESLAARGAPTLFATHYHELTSLADTLETVTNLHVTVREWNDQIIFLHRIHPGRTDRSYGIHVARLAGLPRTTLERAQTVLGSLAVNTGNPAPDPSSEQMALFKEYLPHPVLDRLRTIDLDSVTPLQSFDLLRTLIEDARLGD